MLYEENKTVRLELRLTPAEKKSFEKVAERQQMTLSAFMRFAARNVAAKEIVEIDMAPLRVAMYELRKQGTNLNQLMFFLNTHREQCSETDLENVNKVLSEQWNALRKLLNAFDTVKKKAGVVLINEDINAQEFQI